MAGAVPTVLAAIVNELDPPVTAPKLTLLFVVVKVVLAPSVVDREVPFKSIAFVVVIFPPTVFAPVPSKTKDPKVSADVIDAVVPPPLPEGIVEDKTVGTVFCTILISSLVPTVKVIFEI